MCKQRTPPRFIAYAQQRILAHIVVYVFSLRFISLSISISCFSIFSSASQFVRPALQTVFSGNCGNQIFTYISIFVDALLWFFCVFASGKCNFVPFVLVMTDTTICV